MRFKSKQYIISYAALTLLHIVLKKHEFLKACYCDYRNQEPSWT